MKLNLFLLVVFAATSVAVGVSRISAQGPIADTPLAAQPAVLATGFTSNRIVVFQDGAVPTTQSLVPGLPTGVFPHGVSYYGNDNALVADLGNSRIFVIQVSTASLVSTISTNTAPAWDGSGTIAVSPNGGTALAIGSLVFANTNQLNVIQAPFGPASTRTQLVLPGGVNNAQTQAVVFNSAGRAFVYHAGGISVLDAPYTSIAFTIPVPGISGAIAISPDGNTLLTTIAGPSNIVRVFQGPFSAATTFTNLALPNSSPDGIMIAPDGNTAIVVSVFTRAAFAIKAPFGSNSVVEQIPLPPGGGMSGFEDVGISADSQTAILTGQGGDQDQAILVRAPFGAGSTTALLPITGNVNFPGRGAGAVRFRPTTPVSAPITVSGRVSTPTGLAVRNAVVSLIDAQGNRRTATTSSFGLYSFENVAASTGYILTVFSKRYRYAPKITDITASMNNVDFIGLE